MAPDLTGSVVVITGVMAAGKSTVAQLLAERLPRSAHVHGDEFRRSIVSGRIEVGADGTGTEQLWLRYRLSAMVADQYAAAGFAAIVQDVILGADVGKYVELLKTDRRFLVTLAPRPDVVAAREAARPKSGYGGEWSVESLHRYLVEAPADLGLWLDSSGQTPEQTVDTILANIEKARV
jgi:chloramphenicol 3-O-phosphotransferase